MLTQILIIGLAAGLTSTTVTQSSIFRPLRERVREFRRSELDGKTWFFGELIGCPYCFGHWVSVGFCLWYHLTSPITWLAVAGISALTSGILGKLYGD